MPKITAILHAHNDATRMGRVLDSLSVCNQILVIDHSSDDDTAKIAQEHGATVKEGIPGVENGAYVIDAAYDWIFCILPSESLSESLQASLSEWKEQDEPPENVIGYAFQVRTQKDGRWQSLDSQMRLVNRKRINWTGPLPPNASNGEKLPGDLLRFEEDSGA
jgi:glycosyltransferase involved in cell wall biosynthesis